VKFKIAVLPGDGIGVEVTAQAVRVVRAIADRFGHEVIMNEYLVGGAALDACGTPLPDDTLRACLASDAVLFGAVGAPEYDGNAPPLKPEAALVQLRLKLGTFANLRPAVFHPALIDTSPLKGEIVAGTDILIVRELMGSLYTNEPRGIEATGRGDRGVNTMAYDEFEIERIARVAFEFARQRRRKVTSVDKANMLEVSQLWRRVVTNVSRDYPDVQLEHLLVDNCAMQLLRRPREFDVILTENIFGDILSEEVAAILGSIGLLPSACIGNGVNYYEPVHGSAPDIAGKNMANPIGAIRSAALMFRYSFNLHREANEIEAAVSRVLAQGYRTADLGGGGTTVSTKVMGDLINQEIRSMQRRPDN
jgi:3-isopropylmalate dehydrogenase